MGRASASQSVGPSSISSCVSPKTLFPALMLGAEHETDSVEKIPASSRVVSLRRTLDVVSPS